MSDTVKGRAQLRVPNKAMTACGSTEYNDGWGGGVGSTARSGAPQQAASGHQRPRGDGKVRSAGLHVILQMKGVQCRMGKTIAVGES